jgi:hypothetical protein
VFYAKAEALIYREGGGCLKKLLARINEVLLKFEAIRKSADGNEAEGECVENADDAPSIYALHNMRRVYGRHNQTS